MAARVAKVAKPLIRVKLPRLFSEPYVKFGIPPVTGPLGFVELSRAGVGELTPVNVVPVKNKREAGLK